MTIVGSSGTINRDSVNTVRGLETNAESMTTDRGPMAIDRRLINIQRGSVTTSNQIPLTQKEAIVHCHGSTI